jgi:hypothetical protein
MTNLLKKIKEDIDVKKPRKRTFSVYLYAHLISDIYHIAPILGTSANLLAAKILEQGIAEIKKEIK